MNTQQGIDATSYGQNNWIHGADLDGQIELTAAGVREHSFDDGTRRLVLAFLETERELSLNKTQVKSMIGFFGANTAAWVGQRITLTPIPTQFAGKPSILITRAAPPSMPTFNGQPMAAAVPQPAAADNPWTPPVQAGVTFRQGA